jgi:hypothetical protein
MSEEIRIRADIWDLCNRKHACEVSSVPDTGVATQIELARLMGEAFRVLSHHLVAPPNDHLVLQTFALAALDSDLIFDDEVD